MKVNLKSLGNALHLSANNPKTTSDQSTSTTVDPALSGINQKLNNQASVAPRTNNLPLPDKLRQEIFRHLSGKDIFEASRVSEGFANDINSDPIASSTLKNYELHNYDEVNIIKSLDKFDLENPIPNTDQAKELIEKYKKKSSTDLIKSLKPYLDPEMQVIGMVKILGSKLTGQKKLLELEIKVAFREYLSRGMNVGFLTGQDCTVM